MDTTEPAPDQSPPVPPPYRRIARAVQPRLVAGVCEGLGRSLHVDPVVFRVSFAVLTLVGGSGVLLYLLAWVALPEEGRTTSPLEDLLGGDGRRPSWPVLAVLAVLAVVVSGAVLGGLGGDGGDALLVVVLGLVAYLLWSRGGRGPGGVAPGTSGPGTPAPPPADAPTGPSVPPAPNAGDGPVDAAPGSGDLANASATWPGAVAAPAEAPPAGRSPGGPVSDARRRSLAGPTLSLLVLGAGLALALEVGGVADVSVEAFLAGAVLLVGAALVVGAFVGRSRGLVLLGSVLVVALLLAPTATASVGGGSGQRFWQPGELDELRSSYHLGAGEAVLDLSELSLPDGVTEVAVSVGAGRLAVIAPTDAAVEVDAGVGLGGAHLLGRDEGGIGLRTGAEEQRPGAPTLVVDAEVGVGMVEVDRAAR